MGIDIVNESGIEVDEGSLSDLATFALSRLRIHPAAELSVLLVDAEAMSLLHERWMGETGPTDVLSFEMDELRPTPDDAEPEPGLLGDVVLCPQVATTQAATAGHPVAAELSLLTVHGILHLLGFDHAEESERAEMFGLQTRLLVEWAALRGQP
jgi:probable rRNA maturation factor